MPIAFIQSIQSNLLCVKEAVTLQYADYTLGRGILSPIIRWNSGVNQ